MIARTLFLAAFLLSSPVFGQELLSPDGDRALREGKAAFECAILAAEGTDPKKSMASPLATMAHEKVLAGMDEVMGILREGLGTSGGPLSSYLVARDTSFIVGLSFAEASKNVETFLDGLAPFDGSGSYETIRTFRDFQADLEFDRRNCSLLLP